MTTTVGVCNIALGKLGGNLIMSLEDGIPESDLCKTNHELARDLALESVDWTFARKRASLVPLTGESGTIIGGDFAYRFQLPSNCISLRAVSANGSFDDTLTWEKEGRTLLADKGILYIKYTAIVIDPNLFSPGFVKLYSTQLAADICVALTGNSTLATELYKQAGSLVDHAGGADGVQSLPQKQKATRLINARFGASRGLF